jgi:signal transduction histidine kinase/PAS domain-containing protein
MNATLSRLWNKKPLVSVVAIAAALLACLYTVLFAFDAADALAAGKRYGLWWYLGKLLGVGGLTVVTTGLLIEYVRIHKVEKRIGRELRQSEGQLHSLVESMSEGLAYHEIVYDGKTAVDYVVLNVNSAFERITGIAKKDAEGKRASELYGTGSPPFLDVYTRVAESGTAETFETEFSPMGKHFSISVFSPEKGTFVTVFTDITDRKNDENARLENNAALEKRVVEQTAELRQAYRTLERRVAERTSEVQNANRSLDLSRKAALNILQDAIAAKSRAEKASEELTVVSAELRLAHDELEIRVAERTAELSRANMELAEEIDERVKAEDRQMLINLMLEQFARTSSRKSFLDETVNIIRSWSACEFVGVRMKDDSGNIPFESHVGFDDDFLALENALHVDRDKCICIRAIMNHPTEHERQFVTAGGSFCLNDTAQFAEVTFRDNREEYRTNCVSRGFLSLAVVPIRFNERVYGAIHLADLKKNMTPVQTVQFLESTVAPLIGEAMQRFFAEAELEAHHQHVENLVEQRTGQLQKANEALIREIEQREELSRDLVRSNNDLEQFAYVASHDLQEPLRAVSGFVELLKRDLGETLDGKRTEYMKYVVDGVHRMQSLIHGLLEYSRIGTKGSAPQSTNVKDALHKAILNLRTSIEESGATVRAENLPAVYMDPVQLEQLLQNLVGNALKFRSKITQPEITVSSSRGDGQWLLWVRDNGIGIDPRFTERIFLIFQRLHTRNEYPGTGIGLALCKKIVERHGGKIWVESKPGEGASFFFTIPDTGESLP